MNPSIILNRRFHIFILLSFVLGTFCFSAAAQPSEEELAKLDPMAKRFNIDTTLKRIEAVPFDAEKGFTFVAWGDMRSNPKVFNRLWTEIQQENAMFAMSTGDLVRRGTIPEWLEYLDPVISNDRAVPFLPVIGNHDLGVKKKRAEYTRIFGKLDYVFDYGNVRFVVVDNVDGLTEKQLDWLKTQLDSAGDKLKLVFAHKPPATIEKWDYHAFSDNADVFCELMTKYKVRAAIFGHIHAYSTSNLNGVEYIITGGGGAGLHNRYGPMGNVHHYCVMTVTKEGMSYEVVRLMEDGITRSSSGNEFYQHPRELLTPKVLAAVRKRLPRAKIDDVEIKEKEGKKTFDVELKKKSRRGGRDVTLVITENGEILEMEEELFERELPSAILDYIQAHYPNEPFDEAVKKDEKGQLTEYEVTLTKSDGFDRDLIFDSEGVFFKEDR